MTDSTPAQLRAEAERVEGLLEGTTEGEWTVATEVRFHVRRTYVETVAGRSVAGPTTRADAALMAEAKRLATAHADLLRRHAEMLEAQEWIPVTERLPGIRTPVLVWDGSRCIEGMYEYWDDGDYRFEDAYGRELNVTHWRPLSPPPAQAPASAEGGAE